MSGLTLATTLSIRYESETAPSPVTRRFVRNICQILRKAYKNPRHGNPYNPLDDLIYIILSTRTRDSSFASVFRTLKKRFPVWNAISAKHKGTLEQILNPGGLGKLKTRQLIAIVSELKCHFGTATLAPLAKMANEEAEDFLTSLPGVGPKIAKCVLMYTLNRRVLPVDVHVHRLATRLGFRAKKRPDTSQALIESAVPPQLRYSFHVNAIAHGRAVCISQRPKCEICIISESCQYYRRHRG